MSSFKTYVINLKRDKKKWNDLQHRLLSIGIKPIRFDAIYGKQLTNNDYVKYQTYITKYCWYFCPRTLIGCRLSHLTLYEMAHKQWQTQSFTNDKFFLVLEDDVTPVFKDKTVIEDIINRSPQDADIISLYCQGYCRYNDTLTTTNEFRRVKGHSFTGSTCAILIRYSSVPKLLRKLNYHIDIQLFNDHNNHIYVYHKEMFIPDTSVSYNIPSHDWELDKNIVIKNINKITTKIDRNLRAEHGLGFPIFRLPYFGYEFNILRITQVASFNNCCDIIL
jgi:GR25 family glycosyltransferase involved in LPS biosynthesis